MQMPEIAITLVGNLDPAAENRAAATIRVLGVDGLSLNPLARGKALDILVKGEHALIPALRQALASFGPFDIFVQPNDTLRKKKLLVADMDATMIRHETLDELAAHLGLKDKIAPITEKAMRGEIDFQEALRLRVSLLRGLSAAALQETLAKVEYSEGAATLVKTMARFGARGVLISGGFEQFTQPVAAALGFQRSIGNRLGIAQDRLTGEVLPPIVDKYTKERLVTDEARALGLDTRQVLAIGDGANDIPMLKKAGVGIGYFAKPAVQAATPYQIRHTDLTAALYMQGYRQEELV